MNLAKLALNSNTCYKNITTIAGYFCILVARNGLEMNLYGYSEDTPRDKLEFWRREDIKFFRKT